MCVDLERRVIRIRLVAPVWKVVNRLFLRVSRTGDRWFITRPLIHRPYYDNEVLLFFLCEKESLSLSRSACSQPVRALRPVETFVR